jgi:hypothetical protein
VPVNKGDCLAQRDAVKSNAGAELHQHAENGNISHKEHIRYQNGEFDCLDNIAGMEPVRLFL